MKINSFNYLIIIIICCSTLYSCSAPKFNSEDLIGDWMLPFDSIKATDKDLGFSIIGDSIYTIANDGLAYFQGKISLTNDTLTIHDKDVKKTYNYKVEKLTEDSLILINNRRIYKYHNRRLEFNKNLKFHRISLFLGSEGSPDMKMVLDSTGYLEYSITKKNIHKTFKISTEKRLLIDSLFKSSCINITSTDGWYKGYDGWKKTMIFEYNDEVIAIYTNQMMMPFRINPILYQMIQMIDCRTY